jgi:hypothetical protein
MILHRHGKAYSVPFQVVAMDFLRTHPEGVRGDDIDKALLTFIGAKYKSMINVTNKQNVREWPKLKELIMQPTEDEGEESSDDQSN